MTRKPHQFISWCLQLCIMPPQLSSPWKIIPVVVHLPYLLNFFNNYHQCLMSRFPKTRQNYLPCSNPIVHNCAQKMCPPGCNSLCLQAQAMLHVIALYCEHHLGSAISTIFMDYVYDIILTIRSPLISNGILTQGHVHFLPRSLVILDEFKVLHTSCLQRTNPGIRCVMPVGTGETSIKMSSIRDKDPWVDRYFFHINGH